MAVLVTIAVLMTMAVLRAAAVAVFEVVSVLILAAIAASVVRVGVMLILVSMVAAAIAGIGALAAHDIQPARKVRLPHLPNSHQAAVATRSQATAPRKGAARSCRALRWPA
jgi:hypothetical protein